MNLTRIVLVVALIAIVALMSSALFHLTSARGNPKSLLRALSWRIGLSAGLFVLLFVAWYFGLIQPHGIAGR